MAQSGQAREQVGDIVRYWRKLRRMSQMELALTADISTRHLSFVETGRAKPSQNLLLRLSDILKLPHKNTNLMLVAAGYAPFYSTLALDDERMAHVRHALQRILAQHNPYPAVVLDRGYDMLLQNEGFQHTLRWLLDDQPVPRNMYRFMFEPDGMRRYCPDWSALYPVLLQRLRDESIAYQSDRLTQLYTECLAHVPQPLPAPDSVFPLPTVTFSLVKDNITLQFFSTVTSFGTAIDVTVQELRIESLFPADDATRAFFVQLVEN